MSKMTAAKVVAYTNLSSNKLRSFSSYKKCVTCNNVVQILMDLQFVSICYIITIVMNMIFQYKLIRHHTGDDIQFVHIADLWTKPESLTTNAGVGQSPADGQSQVVGPRHRCKATFERGMQNVAPKLFAADVGVVVTQRRVIRDNDTGAVALTFQGSHVDHDAVLGHGLSTDGVALSSGGYVKRKREIIGRLNQAGNVVYGRWVQNGSWDFSDHIAVIS